jgi:hypothetical protein
LAFIRKSVERKYGVDGDDVVITNKEDAEDDEDIEVENDESMQE